MATVTGLLLVPGRWPVRSLVPAPLDAPLEAASQLAAATPAAPVYDALRRRVAASDAEGGSTAALPITEYTVAEGDTLWTIASRFHTDVASLEASNGLSDASILHPGDRLQVPTQVGWIYTVAHGDTLGGIASRTGVGLDTLLAANHLRGDELLQVGQRLWIPREPSASATGGQGSPGGGGGGQAAVTRRTAAAGFVWPVQGVITSWFGWRYLYGHRDFHDGIDIAVPWGTPVRAAAPGTVIYAGWDGPWGIAVRIQSGNTVTLYAHNSRVAVRPGQQVDAGQVIAYSGSTGNATGPHVHFGIYVGGEAVNPLRYLP